MGKSVSSSVLALLLTLVLLFSCHAFFMPQQSASSSRRLTPLRLSVTSSDALLLSSLVAAVADDVEYAELPAPYIPVVFGLSLIVGVGLLTGSLGDVLDEESQLGMQSGARAKKEIERSRSSYFKKK